MVPASFLVIIRVVYFLNIPTYLRKQLLTQKEEKMIEIKGAFNTAKVFTDMVEPEAMSQIFNICCQKAFEGSKIRIMPDVHAGKGCVIGTTMTITDKVVPNLVGVDIGCGMLVANIGKTDVDFQKLDDLIRKEIPSGFSIRNRAHSLVKKAELSELACAESIDLNRAMLSIGTLGGGNHFLEADRDDDGNVYIVIHSGSRHLGTEVASFYQKKAFEQLSGLYGKEAKEKIIRKLTEEGRKNEIQEELKKLGGMPVPKEFAYCEGSLFSQYINDMKITQAYAVLNRRAMLDVIVSGMNFDVMDTFTTIHNYIDTDNMIVRKGAVSARDGERLIIPMNMRDGSLVCTGKGNLDWNCSAPHGAGRIMSRGKAKATVSVDEYRDSMSGIFSTSVGAATVDESPMVYKPMEEILSNIGDTVSVDRIIRPIYNFKAS